MYSIANLTAALACIASTAFAQEPAWNRKISDVHIVHPPATPPGAYKVVGSLGISADTTVHPGDDLSTTVTLLADDMPVQS